MDPDVIDTPDPDNDLSHSLHPKADDGAPEPELRIEALEVQRVRLRLEAAKLDLERSRLDREREILEAQAEDMKRARESARAPAQPTATPKPVRPKEPIAGLVLGWCAFTLGAGVFFGMPVIAPVVAMTFGDTQGVGLWLFILWIGMIPVTAFGNGIIKAHNGKEAAKCPLCSRPRQWWKDPRTGRGTWHCPACKV